MEKTVSSSTMLKKSTQMETKIEEDQKLNLTNRDASKEHITSSNYLPKQLLPDLEFLDNPQMTKLKYTEKKVSLYSNLYQISLRKNYILYEYAVKFQHEDLHLSTLLKRKVFSKISAQVTEKYGVYLFTGDSLFTTLEVKDVVNLISTFKKFQYSLLVQPTKEWIELRNCPQYMADLYKRKPEVKMILELILKDILRHNPSLKFVKNLYGKKYSEKSVKADDMYNSISVMPGFSTKVMFLEQGIFLNVDIKNKILSSSHCLELINSYIKNPKNVTRDEMASINKFFKGRTVETIHTNQRFKVELVNFDKRASNYSINFENTNVVLTKYYKNLYDLDIEPSSPLLLIKSKGKNENKVGRYIPPQLCLMVGLTDEMQQDFNLMQKLAKVTKLDPQDKVESINDIIKLLNDKTGIKKKNKTSGQEYVLKSAYEKKQEYGIEISEVKADQGFFGYMIKNPTIKGKDDKIIPDIRRPFNILEAKKINFLCLYHREYKEGKKKMTELMKSAGEPYGIVMGKMDFLEMSSEDPKEWMSKIEKNNSSSYNLVIILLDEYLKLQGLYDPLKKHSMENKGYVTQIVCTKSIYGKNAMSIISNILLQANSKIGGSSYKIEFDSEVKKRNLMLVGIESSNLKNEEGAKGVVAMCATLNNNFTTYTHKKIEIEDDIKNCFSLPVASFIYEAICEYFKLNKKLPGGVVIYRQGVSREQKLHLSAEVESINNLLNGCTTDYELLSKMKIPYYYILVNKKTSLKFFESDSSQNSFNSVSSKTKGKFSSIQQTFDNPDPGLLIYNSMTDPEIFEFYLQPQKVNQGTATPTNFHVAFGTLDCPEIIPKLTYDLCYLYTNWRGPVRVPAPLKYAEKLAKTIPKLNEKIKNTLCYI
jgi:aubergine-like protein